MTSLARAFMIGRRLPAVAALLVFCSICGPYAAIAQEHPAHEWGYSGSEGCCLTNYLAHFCANYLAHKEGSGQPLIRLAR